MKIFDIIIAILVANVIWEAVKWAWNRDMEYFRKIGWLE